MNPFPFKKYKILLDTCVLSDYLSKDDDIRRQTIDILVNLISNENILFISNLSLFELIRGLTKEKERDLVSKIKPFFRYVVNEHILMKSARLSNLYKKEGLSIDDIDTMIATNAISDGVHMHFILTGNGKHFPKPFFREYHRDYIQYGTTKNNHGRVKIVHFLFPDIKAINSLLSQEKMGIWQDTEEISNTLLASEINISQQKTIECPPGYTCTPANEK